MYGCKSRGEELTGEIKRKDKLSYPLVALPLGDKYFNGYIVNFVKHGRSTSTGRRRAVRSLCLEENILKFAADRSESSTRAVDHHLSESHRTICGVLKQNRLLLFHFQRVQALIPVDYLLRLSVGDTGICVAAGLHSSCTEQL
ncbi:hypothetical protein TNCV_3213791 [Trichonephila clavipes]|nr:hypothetical protein TNCV_3213791 [Trichonephila clavipes]